MPTRTRLIAIGACAIDTILTVPYYPDEDSKLRATSFQKRRGGNVPNTLEVLQQLICRDEAANTSSFEDNGTQQVGPQKSAIEMHLIATLPSHESPQLPFMKSSFNHCSPDKAKGPKTYTECPQISFESCIYRPNYHEPVSSYIIASQANSSRTIVNHMALPEMTFPELQASITPLLSEDGAEQIWVHFEGRNVDVALECMQFLRSYRAFSADDLMRSEKKRLVISVELEKPGREGLQDLAHYADVVFYSRSWAEGEGYADAEDCLRRQYEVLSKTNSLWTNHKTLVCTWGSKGACAVPKPSTSRSSSDFIVVHSRAHTAEGKEIVDTTGAGDTFVAGVLFGLICRSQGFSSPERLAWSLQNTLDFANGLAGRKILQQGFDNLGEKTKSLKMELDGEAQLHSKSIS